MIVHTLDSGLIDILPCVCSTKYIVYFLAIEMHLILEFLLHYEDIWTRFAKESEVVGGLFGQQDVGARRAKEHFHSLIKLIKFDLFFIY